MYRPVLVGAAWLASLACAGVAGWTARGPSAPTAAAEVVRAAVASRDAAPFEGWMPPATPNEGLRAVTVPPPAMRAQPAAVAAASNADLGSYLSGTDSDRYLALGRARAERLVVPPQVLQTLLFGPGSSGLRLAALDLWAETLEGDPPAQQALFEQALQASDDAVRAEARARLDEAALSRQRAAAVR